jgi:hypothetical protein
MTLWTKDFRRLSGVNLHKPTYLSNDCDFVLSTEITHAE